MLTNSRRDDPTAELLLAQASLHSMPAFLSKESFIQMVVHGRKSCECYTRPEPGRLIASNKPSGLRKQGMLLGNTLTFALTTLS